MENRFDVLVVGELNIDLILTGLDNLPQIGKEILADEMSLTLGSSAAIFASNLSTLGSRVCFVGKTGKDQFGNQIRKYLSEKGVDISQILHSDTSKTGITIALSYENERAMVTHPGTMAELEASDVREELLKSCSHLHVSSIFLQPALKKNIVSLFQRAKDAGLTTSLDTQWDPEEKWDCDWKRLLPLVDIFMPNLEEIKNITKEKDPKSCINTIKNYANVIVIKCGKEGSVAWEDGTFYNQPVFLNSNVKDAIGAGDSFNAGFIHQFLRNKTLKECLKLGSLCGAINTTAYGGTTAFKNNKKIQQIAFEQFKHHLNDL